MVGNENFMSVFKRKWPLIGLDSVLNNWLVFDIVFTFFLLRSAFFFTFVELESVKQKFEKLHTNYTCTLTHTTIFKPHTFLLLLLTTPRLCRPTIFFSFVFVYLLLLWFVAVIKLLFLVLISTNLFRFHLDFNVDDDEEGYTLGEKNWRMKNENELKHTHHRLHYQLILFFFPIFVCSCVCVIFIFFLFNWFFIII